MTNFEMIKSKNIDEFIELFSEHFRYDNAPWWKYFDDNYCRGCKPVTTLVESTNREIDEDKEMEYAWCELNHKCKFFQEMDEIPDEKQIIKMWLLSECE